MGIYKRGVVISGVVSLTMGNSALPLAHGRIGHKELVGELALREPERPAALGDELAEGFLLIVFQGFGLLSDCPGV